MIYIFLILAALGSVVSAQTITHRIEQIPQYTVNAVSDYVRCNSATVGEGLGECRSRTMVEVYNSPKRNGTSTFDCVETWALYRDSRVEYRDFNKKVTLALHEGEGYSSYEIVENVRKLSDPVRRVVASRTRCFSTAP